MTLLALVLFAFASAPLVGLAGGRSSSFVAAAPFLLFVAFCALLPAVTAGDVLLEAHPWIPGFGIEAAFRLDGLSLVFALLITGIGSVVFLYASAYLRGAGRLARFYVALTLFMASMLGAVLADDLVLLVVFWELTSFTSFLLIGYSPEQPEARRAAQQGFLVTTGGGLAMLAGIILLGSVAGTYSITGLMEQGEIIAAHPTTPVIVLLIAAGAFAKSAQVPLHSWLANAMVAPTPVSAYLHSATMVKLGVYLLARLSPVFDGHGLWSPLLLTFGAATLLAGAVLALRETDLKLVLAYSTIASLGTLILLIGIPGDLAAIGAVTFLIAHALYKACLFLVAGILDHETGTRDSTILGGLRRFMPATAVVALVGGLSMAGLPPFIGFAAKELVYETALGAPVSWMMIAIALVANVAMVVVAGVVAVRSFSGVPKATPKQTPHDPGFAMLSGPALLALLGLVFGVVPWLVGDALIAPAASAITGQSVMHEFALWHGLTPMIALSVLTLALGAYVYLRWEVLRTRLSRIRQIDSWGPDRGYDRVMDGLQRLALWQTGRIQPGSLRVYVGRLLIVIAVAAGATLVLRVGIVIPSFSGSFAPELALVGLLVLATLAVARARNFLRGIIAAGMVGFVVALIYLFEGAPDLAFTQFSVEALAIVIFLAIVGRLPFREEDYRTRSECLRDAGVAGATGLAATFVFLSVLSLPFDARLSDYFRQTSVPEAHGHNLVNVIIVDFRALDTLGEITVLSLAAIAAAAVITGLRRRIDAEKRS